MLLQRPDSNVDIWQQRKKNHNQLPANLRLFSIFK